MKQLKTTDLLSIEGGSAQDVCTALQNYANQFGDNWTDKEWEKWAIEYETLCALSN